MTNAYTQQRLFTRRMNGNDANAAVHVPSYPVISLRATPLIDGFVKRHSMLPAEIGSMEKRSFASGQVSSCAHLKLAIRP
eukprot:6180691-Pleurochrysis_carterae.AAC.7